MRSTSGTWSNTYVSGNLLEGLRLQWDSGFGAEMLPVFLQVAVEQDLKPVFLVNVEPGDVMQHRHLILLLMRLKGIVHLFIEHLMVQSLIKLAREVLIGLGNQL